MGGGSAPKNTTSTTTQGISPQLQPYADTYLKRAAYLGDQPYQPYQGQRIANLSPEHERGLNMITQRATAGSPLLRTAQGQLQSTLRGDYLNTDHIARNQYAGANPYTEGLVNNSLSDVTNQFMRTTRPQTDAAFARGNAYGGSAYNELNQSNNQTLMKQLGDLSTSIRGQDFERQAGLAEADIDRRTNYLTNERTNQQRAAAFAPQMAAADYDDAERLLGVGDFRRENTQDALNMAFDQWQQQQAYPQQQLDQYGNALGTLLGRTGTASQTAPNQFRPSKAVGAAGGALTGAASGAMYGSVVPGVGTATGAIAGGIGGGLLGLFAS